MITKLKFYVMLLFTAFNCYASDINLYTNIVSCKSKREYQKKLNKCNKDMFQERQKILNEPMSLCIVSYCNDYIEHDVLRMISDVDNASIQKISYNIQSNKYIDAMDEILQILSNAKQTNIMDSKHKKETLRVYSFSKLLLPSIQEMLRDRSDTVIDCFTKKFNYIQGAISSNDVNSLLQLNEEVDTDFVNMTFIKIAYIDIFNCLFNFGRKKDDAIYIIKYMHDHKYLDTYHYDYTKIYRYKIIADKLSIKFDDDKSCECNEESDEYTYTYESEESDK